MACSYSRSVVISKSDTVNIDGTAPSSNGQAVLGTKLTDAIYVGGAGVVAAVFQDGSVINFTAVAGEIIPIRVMRVNNTNTTATLMNGLFN